MERLKSQEVSGRRRSEGESPEFQVRAMYEVREEARVRQSIDESEKHWRGDRGEGGREGEILRARGVCVWGGGGGPDQNSIV